MSQPLRLPVACHERLALVGGQRDVNAKAETIFAAEIAAA
jgi:hypothetical protein